MGGTAFHQRLAKRYRQLRSGALSADWLLKRVDEAYAQLHACGADRREAERWNGSSCATFKSADERERLARWLTRRIKALDKKYGK